LRILVFIHDILHINWYQNKLASLMDGDGSNPLRDAGVKAFQSNVWAQEEKLDSFALSREQRIDCLKQVITDLTL
jgi:hypothetical protein